MVASNSDAQAPGLAPCSLSSEGEGEGHFDESAYEDAYFGSGEALDRVMVDTFTDTAPQDMKHHETGVTTGEAVKRVVDGTFAGTAPQDMKLLEAGVATGETLFTEVDGTFTVMAPQGMQLLETGVTPGEACNSVMGGTFTDAAPQEASRERQRTIASLEPEYAQAYKDGIDLKSFGDSR